MRSFHQAGLTSLSPDGVQSRRTLSKLSAAMNRSCTGCSAHWVNTLVRGSIAASSMVLSLTHESFHGAAALASAVVIATTVCVPSVAGHVQLATACAAAPAGALPLFAGPLM